MLHYLVDNRHSGCGRGRWCDFPTSSTDRTGPDQVFSFFIAFVNFGLFATTKLLQMIVNAPPALGPVHRSASTLSSGDTPRRDDPTLSSQVLAHQNHK